MIPHIVGLDNGYRTHNADAQTICLCAKDLTRTIEVQFFKATLEIVPCLKTLLFTATLWLGLVCTQENVFGMAADPKVLGLLSQFIGGFHFFFFEVDVVDVGLTADSTTSPAANVLSVDFTSV